MIQQRRQKKYSQKPSWGEVDLFMEKSKERGWIRNILCSDVLSRYRHITCLVFVCLLLLLYSLSTHKNGGMVSIWTSYGHPRGVMHDNGGMEEQCAITRDQYINHVAVGNTALSSIHLKSHQIHPQWTSESIHFPATTSPSISVIIVTYNNAMLLLHLLQTLHDQSGAPTFEVIVVDNGCTSGVDALVSGLLGGVKYVKACENPGYAKGNNIGMDYMHPSSEWVLFLNDDVLLHEGVLANLKAAVDVLMVLQRSQKDGLRGGLDNTGGGKEIGGIGCKMLDFNGNILEAGSIVWNDATTDNYMRGGKPFLPETTFLRYVDYISGACLMMNREILEEYGGLRDDLYEAYFEDTDLCMHINHDLNQGLVYLPWAIASHYEHASFKGGAHVELMDKSRETFKKRWANKLYYHSQSREQYKSDQDIKYIRLLTERKAGEAAITGYEVNLWGRDMRSEAWEHVLIIIDNLMLLDINLILCDEINKNKLITLIIHADHTNSQVQQQPREELIPQSIKDLLHFLGIEVIVNLNRDHLKFDRDFLNKRSFYYHHVLIPSKDYKPLLPITAIPHLYIWNEGLKSYLVDYQWNSRSRLTTLKPMKNSNSMNDWDLVSAFCSSSESKNLVISLVEQLVRPGSLPLGSDIIKRNGAIFWHQPYKSDSLPSLYIASLLQYIASTLGYSYHCSFGTQDCPWYHDSSASFINIYNQKLNDNNKIKSLNQNDRICLGPSIIAQETLPLSFSTLSRSELLKERKKLELEKLEKLIFEEQRPWPGDGNTIPFNELDKKREILAKQGVGVEIELNTEQIERKKLYPYPFDVTRWLWITPPKCRTKSNSLTLCELLWGKSCEEIENERNSWGDLNRYMDWILIPLCWDQSLQLIKRKLKLEIPDHYFDINDSEKSDLFCPLENLNSIHPLEYEIWGHAKTMFNNQLNRLGIESMCKLV